MKLSTRNNFAGTIKGIKRGPVSTEVTIQVAKGVEIVSVITTNSAKPLKLKRVSARTRSSRPITSLSALTDGPVTTAGQCTSIGHRLQCG